MRQGSALLIVMMVMAGLVTVVFGSQRVALVQYNQATAEEDSLYALYAAKAGIQDGLLRFRTERNVETSTNKVFRFNLTTGESVRDSAGIFTEVAQDTPVAKLNAPDYKFSYRPNQQIYDLSISFRTQAQGAEDLTSVSASILTRGETLELSGFPPNLASGAYYLRYKLRQTDAACQNGSVQIQSYRVLNDGTVFGYDQRLVDMASGEVDSRTNGSNLAIYDPVGSLSNTVRIRAYNCDVKYYLATALGSDSPGSEPEAPQFDSQKTLIISTGYYGKSKKTLVAEISRTSGQLLGIYDYTIYAGRKIGSP